MKRLAAAITLGTLASVLSCASTGGTETDNPAATLKDYQGSACKNKEPSPNPQALTLAPDTEGLQCVHWQKRDGLLHLSLNNFPEPCGNQYLGRAEVSQDALELTVYKDTCALFKCGWCIYDFDFTVGNVSLEMPLKLSIGSAVCEGKPRDSVEELTLPLDEQDSGVTCRYVPASPLEWYANERGTCGERNMPCGKCYDSTDTTCESGTTCSELATNDSRCLPNCESDDDCAPGITTCQGGVCQASVTF